MADGNFTRRMPVFVDGTPLEYVTSLEVNGESNAQKIVTMLDGLIGFSDGPAEVNITIESAIPIGGPEYDYWNSWNDGGWHSLQIGVGSKDYVGDGRFLRVNFSASSDKSASVRAEWTGKPAKME